MRQARAVFAKYSDCAHRFTKGHFRSSGKFEQTAVIHGVAAILNMGQGIVAASKYLIDLRPIRHQSDVVWH